MTNWLLTIAVDTDLGDWHCWCLLALDHSTKYNTPTCDCQPKSLAKSAGSPRSMPLRWPVRSHSLPGPDPHSIPPLSLLYPACRAHFTPPLPSASRALPWSLSKRERDDREDQQKGHEWPKVQVQAWGMGTRGGGCEISGKGRIEPGLSGDRGLMRPGRQAITGL